MRNGSDEGYLHLVWNRMVYNVALVVVISVPLSGQSPSANGQHENAGGHLATRGLAITNPYRAITGRERLRWTMKSTVGPESLGAGLLSAGFGTATNRPREYAPSWGGFGKRYGMRLTGISTGNVMEASLGAIWGEDPRYDRAPDAPFGTRVRNVIKLTFAAPRRDGHLAPAYARFIAIPGNNILSNTWRPDSETYAADTALRTIWGILGRMGTNAIVEFWPDIRQRLFHS